MAKRQIHSVSDSTHSGSPKESDQEAINPYFGDIQIFLGVFIYFLRRKVLSCKERWYVCNTYIQKSLWSNVPLNDI